MQHGPTLDLRTDEENDGSDAGASPLMELNPAVYDRSLPPSVPQVIMVCLPGLQGLANKASDLMAEGPERNAEQRRLAARVRDAVRIRDQLDWAALEALVRP
jgi:hypothetical protein